MELVPYEIIELDKPRKLRLSFGTLRRFEELTGKDFFRTLASGGMLGIADISALLYASFSAEDPELTQEQLDGRLHYGLVPKIAEAIGRLAEASAPPAKAGGGAEKKRTS